MSMTTDEIVQRIRTKCALKIVLSLGLTIGFYAFYLPLQRCPLFPVTALRPSSIDRVVPFQPGAVYLYESLWLIMPIAPWLMVSTGELRRYSRGFAAMALTGFAIFLFFPTSGPRPGNLRDVNVVYEALIVIDNELNAFPSLHAAFAFFHGAHCHAMFRRGASSKWLTGFLWLWVLGIAASTLLTKQHVFVDVAAGAVLGLGSYFIFCRPAKHCVDTGTKAGLARNPAGGHTAQETSSHRSSSPETSGRIETRLRPTVLGLDAALGWPPHGLQPPPCSHSTGRTRLLVFRSNPNG